MFFRRIRAWENDQDVGWVKLVLLKVNADAFRQFSVLVLGTVKHLASNRIIRIEELRKIARIRIRASSHCDWRTELKVPPDKFISNSRPDRRFLEHLDKSVGPIKAKAKRMRGC